MQTDLAGTVAWALPRRFEAATVADRPDTGDCARRQARNAGPVRAASAARLSLRATPSRRQGRRRGPGERGVPRGVASCRKVRGPLPGLDLAAGDHPQSCALSMLRRRQMERLDCDEAAAIPDHADDPETAIQKQQQSAILAHCLTKLSAAHREVIDLVYYHGRSIDEVAAIIRVPPSTVKTRMFYARNRIAQLLGRFGLHRALPAADGSACRRQARHARARAAGASLH